MPHYTFGELLTIVFQLYKPAYRTSDRPYTQSDLAQDIGVSLATITNWFSGTYVPRSKAHVLAIARELDLPHHLADLLLFTAHAHWVTYQTPHSVLEAYRLLRYEEHRLPSAPGDPTVVGAVDAIEREWPLYFHDTFANNGQHWGLGSRDDGIFLLRREITDGCYRLTAENTFHGLVMGGGDSACFAPPHYYCTVWARRISGATLDDGPGLIFEELCDNSHAVFRLRDTLSIVTVLSTRNGGDLMQVHVDRTPAPSTVPGGRNKLGILAHGEQHWFFINDTVVAQATIPRIEGTRLDVGVISYGDQPVTCLFEDFCVRIPPSTLTPSTAREGV
jgi:DNA-binding XRE family transcriptional regulator